MVEWYECDEIDCDTLVDVTYTTYRAGSVFCRWHQRKLPQRKPQTPIPKQVSHVSERVGPCFYCGLEENLTRDHVIPKCEGKQFRGTWNRVWACEFCNRKKANLQLAEWLVLIQEYVNTHGWNGVHVKYQRVLERSRRIVTHLLTDPSHEHLKKYRVRIDPWWGHEPKPVLRYL